MCVCVCTYTTARASCLIPSLSHFLLQRTISSSASQEAKVTVTERQWGEFLSVVLGWNESARKDNNQPLLAILGSVHLFDLCNVLGLKNAIVASAQMVVLLEIVIFNHTTENIIMFVIKHDGLRFDSVANHHSSCISISPI